MRTKLFCLTPVLLLLVVGCGTPGQHMTTPDVAIINQTSLSDAAIEAAWETELQWATTNPLILNPFTGYNQWACPNGYHGPLNCKQHYDPERLRTISKANITVKQDGDTNNQLTENQSSPYKTTGAGFTVQNEQSATITIAGWWLVQPKIVEPEWVLTYEFGNVMLCRMGLEMSGR